MCKTCRGSGEVALRAETNGIVEAPYDRQVDHEAWPCSACRK